MTLGQYRALVAYLNYWTPMYPELNIDAALIDIGITDPKSDVIEELEKAGHLFDEATGLLTWSDE